MRTGVPYWLHNRKGYVLVLDEDYEGNNTVAYVFKPYVFGDIGIGMVSLVRKGWAAYTYDRGWQYLFKKE